MVLQGQMDMKQANATTTEYLELQSGSQTMMDNMSHIHKSFGFNNKSMNRSFMNRYWENPDVSKSIIS
jgi:hypothetical protein